MSADFDQDGFTDVAYVYADQNGRVNIDIYVNNHGFGLIKQRWATSESGWVDQMVFQAADFDGDGYPDIAAMFDNGNGTWDIDVYRSKKSLANGGFAAVERWNSQEQGVIGAGSASSMVDRSNWQVGRFDSGDRLGDLAYLFADPNTGDIDIDVYRSTGSKASGGFKHERWATNQGGWIGLGLSDPSHNLFAGRCKACEREGMWAAGDYNGDGLTDLALAFDDGSGRTNVDVHFSTGTTSGGFKLQRAATSVSGWERESWWTSIDLDGDGRDDLVDNFSLQPGAGTDVDGFLSNMPFFSTTLSGTNNFKVQRQLTGGADYFSPSQLVPRGAFMTGNFRNAKVSAGDVMLVVPGAAPNNTEALYFYPSSRCGVLPSGGTLFAGNSLFSCDGQYQLAMQTDGNLVLYKAGVGPVWATHTSEGELGRPKGSLANNRAVMQQSDGNLVVRDPSGNVYWAANWVPGFVFTPGAELAVQGCSHGYVQVLAPDAFSPTGTRSTNLTCGDNTCFGSEPFNLFICDPPKTA